MKFIALAQRFIEENGKGIIGYITPNTHLDSLTFRGMRYQLLKTFDNIYIINLHGSNKTKETCSDGSKDENVFGIESGVCITLFVKTGTEKGESSLAKVYYKDVYGKKKTSLISWSRTTCWLWISKKLPLHHRCIFFSLSRRTWKQNSGKDSLLKSSL